MSNVVAILPAIALIFLFLGKSNEQNPDSTLQCHRRIYNHNITRKDFLGRACWDVAPVVSCWGRCDSHETSDWKFPYKRSHHPVCIHDVTEHTKIVLKNCDAEVQSGTEIIEFLQAVSCKCAACKSSEANCEGIQYRDSKFHPDLIVN